MQWLNNCAKGLAIKEAASFTYLLDGVSDLVHFVDFNMQRLS